MKHQLSILFLFVYLVLAGCRPQTAPETDVRPDKPGLPAIQSSLPLKVVVDDPLRDHWGQIDVAGMVFRFNNTTGDYRIELTADAAHPFVGDFRININLFNSRAESFFHDYNNDFSMTIPRLDIALVGRSPELVAWEAEDPVYTWNFLPGAPFFRSSVADLPVVVFLDDEDVISPCGVARRATPCPVLVSAEMNVISVEIDVKPGSDINSINCFNGNQLIPVAILSNQEFDATMVDHTTVRFALAAEVHRHRTGAAIRHEKDVDDDGDIDLVVHVSLHETNLTCSSTFGRLTGETFDGELVSGMDGIRMVGDRSASSGSPRTDRSMGP